VSERFIDVYRTFLQLIERKEWTKALTIAEQAEIFYPDKSHYTSFWKSCLLAKLHRLKEALAQLKSAIQEGIWWNPETLLNEEMFHSIQQDEEFQQIVQICKQRFHEQQNKAQPALYVIGNNKNREAIFSLHWRGDNAFDFAEYWKDEKLLEQHIFGFPQSSQVRGYQTFCWDDKKTAMKDIESLYHLFQNRYLTNENEVILAGASQGGKLAIELALAHPAIKVKGFIAVVPAIKDLDEFIQLFAAREIRNVPGYIITGRKDRFYDNTEKLCRLFQHHHIQCELYVDEQEGHMFPKQFHSLLMEAIHFIRIKG
jgi:predicted esterase